MLTHTREWCLVHDSVRSGVSARTRRGLPRRAFCSHPLAAGMAATEDFAGSKPFARAKHVGGDVYETYEAGQSEGQSSGEIIVGWGSMVRAAPALSSPHAHSSLCACWQCKLANSRLKTRPACGSLTVADLEIIEVPAMSSFSTEVLTWWGERGAADQDKQMKALWRRVDKSKLPDKTVAPAFPGAPGCGQDWAAHLQEFCDGYNAGHVPECFLHVGKWPDEVDELHVYPGLKRIAKQQRLVMRALHATPWECVAGLGLVAGSGRAAPCLWMGGAGWAGSGEQGRVGEGWDPLDPCVRLGWAGC